MRFSGARRPPDADLLVAAGLLEVWVTGTARGPRDVATVVAVLSTVPLAWRRRAPLVAVAGAVAAILLPLVPRPLVETDGLAVAIAWLVAVHAINAYRPLRTAALGTLAVVASMILVIAIVPAPPGQQPGDVVWTLAIFGAAAAAGQVMRRLGVRLVSERAAAEAEARAVEQRRLARELHDVVARGAAPNARPVGRRTPRARSPATAGRPARPRRTGPGDWPPRRAQLADGRRGHRARATGDGLSGRAREPDQRAQARPPLGGLREGPVGR